MQLKHRLYYATHEVYSKHITTSMAKLPISEIASHQDRFKAPAKPNTLMYRQVTASVEHISK